MTEYRLIRSKRKSLAIQITPVGDVVVRAPNRLSHTAIEAFLHQKQDWIAAHQQTARERTASRAAFHLDEHNSLPLRGREYPIRLWDRREASFKEGCCYLPAGELPARKAALEQCYRRLALTYLPKRTMELARITGMLPAQITVGGARTRWGSCTADGRIRFSWRLMAVSDRAIDYVIVHELCHCWELNHSPRFWALVEAVLSDYRERKALLRQLQDHPVMSL